MKTAAGPCLPEADLLVAEVLVGLVYKTWILPTAEEASPAVFLCANRRILAGTSTTDQSGASTMLLRHAIGHALRRLRLEQGKTLRQLAQASRVSLPYLSEIERGRKEASSEILATVCRVLDVSLGDLLNDVSRELAVGEVAAVLELTSINGVTTDIGGPAVTSHDVYLMAA